MEWVAGWPWNPQSRFMTSTGGISVELSIAFCYCLVSAEITARLGFHQAIGAIVAAYVFCKVPGLQLNWESVIGRFSGTFLTPLFFAYSGLQASFGSFSESHIWGWLALFIVGGFLGKIGGAYWGGRVCGLTSATAMEVGMLMNTKGLVELVMLNIGLELGILSATTYSVLLVLALLSTIMTMPLLNMWMQRSPRTRDISTFSDS